MASRCSSILRAVSRPTSTLRYSGASASSRWLATAAAEANASSSSTPPPAQTSANPTITRIVDDISRLTLLEAADLVTQLKTRLNIQEIAMPAAAAAAAPAAAAPASDEPAAEKPKEKTVFNLKLESFDAGAKPKVIREVKALVPNLTLMDAKKFVESVPKVLKENMTKDEAEKLQKAFEAIGAVVKLE
ncbi:ClpS-like protein [Agrocybe pediades]|nr:ClpS-like protein [Agrocybe pediades]